MQILHLYTYRLLYHQIFYTPCLSHKIYKLMHVAYSAIRQKSNKQQVLTPVTANRQLSLRYRGYEAACKKYEQEIAAIRLYIPGWQPSFK